MGLKVHQDGVTHVNSLKVAKCASLREIVANMNLMVQLEERLETS